MGTQDPRRLSPEFRREAGTVLDGRGRGLGWFQAIFGGGTARVRGWIRGGVGEERSQGQL